MRIHLSIPIAATVLLLSVCQAPAAVIIKIHPEYFGEYYNPFDRCDGITPGGTKLHEPEMEFLKNLPENSAVRDGILKHLRDQYPVDDSGRAWKYRFAKRPLNGIMWVDWYRAVDKHIASVCRHEAQLSVHYERVRTDPKNLDFIQFWDWNWDNLDGSAAASDHDIVDGEPRDRNPAYYVPGDPRPSYIDNTEGVILTDTPGFGHKEVVPWEGSMSYITFLAAYNGNTITLYNAIEWGFVAECTPEPSSAMLLCVVIVTIFSGSCQRAIRVSRGF